MAKLSKFAGSEELARDGVWCPYAEDIEVLISRIGTPRYNATLRKRLKPYERAIRLGLDGHDEDTERCVMRTVADEIVHGWRNIQDDDLAPIEWSRDKCFELISNPSYRDFYDFIMGCAADASLFREDLIEAAAGNSSSSSSGAPTTENPEI